MTNFLVWFSAGMQWLILLVVCANLWRAYVTGKATRETSRLIYQYRSEIAWLTMRIEALEGQRAPLN